jgi:hypothetical protein
MITLYMPEIHLSDEKQKKILDDHSKEVLSNLQKEINKLNDMLQWKSGLEDSFSIFRVVEQYADEYFAEIGFDSNRRYYRAILGWIESREQFVVLTVFEKEEHYQTSKQNKIFNQIDRHGKKIMERERKKY